MLIKEYYIEQLDKKARIFFTDSLLNSESIIVYVLNKYYNEKIDKNQISYGIYGKPFLKNNKYNFNTSNSGKKTVIAISSEPIGIDIQKIRNKEFLYEYFHENELRIASNLLGNLKGSILLWTIKEAYTKLLGLGTIKSFEEIVVNSLNPIIVIDKQKIEKEMPDFIWKNIADEYILTVCM